MIRLNPTGGRVRIDGHGNGAFGASRGSREHRGEDRRGEPGQWIVSPVDGKLVGTGYPYGDGGPWDCYVKIIEDDGTEWRLFYCRPIPALLGKRIEAGQVIGRLQDISGRYPETRSKGKMLPHCHVERIVDGVRVPPELQTP